MRTPEIPVYAVCGFLDAGKTEFINGVLQDGFAWRELEDGSTEGIPTLLLCCEEGELEYPDELLDNVTVIQVEEQEDFTTAFLKELTKAHRPEQILVEYNGMWPLSLLFQAAPRNWAIYQIMTMVEASTFDLYARNMGQLMMEKIQNADLLIFNRCTEELRTMLRSRNLRMVNRRADIFLENEDGSSENYLTGDECPFDLNQEVIAVPDEDYGVWYVDVMDNPERYAGHRVHMKLIMCHSPKYRDMDFPGRFAMVCCANDIQFLGICACGPGLSTFQNRDWMELDGVMAVEDHPAYNGEPGPVIHVTSVRPCEPPESEIVTF